jgi:hypothetical protein
VPSPVIRDVTLTSYQFDAETFAKLAKMAESAAGAVFQLTVPSLQVVFATRWNSPPNGEPSTQYKRIFALVMVLFPIPETVNFNSMLRTGLLSVTICVDEP